jgi:hypothetical protein
MEVFVGPLDDPVVKFFRCCEMPRGLWITTCTFWILCRHLLSLDTSPIVPKGDELRELTQIVGPGGV